MITPGASGLYRLDTVTKTKTVQVVQQSYQVASEDRRFAETLYPMVAGLHPGRDLSTAPKQPPVFAPILRLLATLST